MTEQNIIANLHTWQYYDLHSITDSQQLYPWNVIILL